MEADQASTDESLLQSKRTAAAGGWLFPLMLMLVLFGFIAYAISSGPPVGQGSTAEEQGSWTPTPEPAGETVQLVIDFGNGARRHFESLAWSPDMTVGDVMVAAREFRPSIHFTQQGEGASGFLTSLEGLQNEGVRGNNWRFLVDGRLGEESFCLAKVKSGGTVLWEYTAEY